MAKITSFSDHFNRPAIENISYEGITRSTSAQAFQQTASITPTQATIANKIQDLGEATLVAALRSNLAPSITDSNLLRPSVFHAATQSLLEVKEIAQNHPKLLEYIKELASNHEAVQSGAQSLVPA